MLNQTGERELAYVVTVDDITSIPGYDRVELAHVGGWTVVVGKGEFHNGDFAVYFEVDSKLPEVKPFTDMDFLSKKHYKIKTQKMCKSFSQGLLMSADNFGWTKNENGLIDKEGNLHKVDDESRFLTKLLDVTYATMEDNTRKKNFDSKEAKYKAMAQRKGKLFSKQPFRWLMKRTWGKKLLFLFFGKKKDTKTAFPTHLVAKTDQERCLFAKTKILTDKGEIEISKIVNDKLDVKVLSMNSDGTLSYKKILNYQKFPNNEEVLTIRYPFSPGVKKNNAIVCTPDHRFFTQRGYIHARDLTLNDYLYMPTNSYQEDCIGTIYGMLLGDSCIGQDKRSMGKIKIIATNGQDQLDYLIYKKSCFQNEGSLVESGKGSYPNAKMCYHWSLPVDAFIDQKIKKDFLVNNKKTITTKVCEQIDEIGLAFWYMDDGNLSYRDGKQQKPSIRLNTQGFSKKENDLLCKMLKERFGISCHVTEEKRKGKPIYYHIYIDVIGTPKFLQLVTPYMCKSMSYKTLPELEALIETKKPTFYKKERVINIPIVSIENGQKKYKTLPSLPKYMYDLEIEDNHNFISANIVSHNCENMTWVLKDKTPFIVTQKCDGSSGTYILERKGFRKYEFYVCSRNVRQLDMDQESYYKDKNYYWECAIKYDIQNKMKDYLNKHPELKFVCWQGEVCAPAIQGNPHNLTETHLFCFHMIDNVNGKYDIREAKKIWDEYSMETVPIVDENYILPDDFEEFKVAADGYYDPICCEGKKDCPREGYVYYKTTDPNFSFKNVSRNYLLKH